MCCFFILRMCIWSRLNSQLDACDRHLSWIHLFVHNSVVLLTLQLVSQNIFFPFLPWCAGWILYIHRNTCAACKYRSTNKSNKIFANYVPKLQKDKLEMKERNVSILIHLPFVDPKPFFMFAYGEQRIFSIQRCCFRHFYPSRTK